MGFWKGAIGTKKQKIFWIIFSCIVALLCAAIIFFLLPRRVHQTLALKGGEWVHFYPDQFWHGSAEYTVTTSAGTAVTDAPAYVYNIDIHGAHLDFDMKADGIDGAIGDGVTADKISPNWNASIIATEGSSLSVKLEPTSSLVPIDFIVTSDSETFDAWLANDKSKMDMDEVLEMLEGVTEISSSVTISTGDKYIATEQVNVGIRVVPGSSKVTRLDGYFYHHIAMATLENCTDFASSPASFELNARQLLQINAPEQCTGEGSDFCKVDVVLQPRWGLFFGVVVVPVCLIGFGFVFGMMAVKAFHVRQMITEMRKKASEEGVALEEGKSKDIHQERLDEANAEGDMSEPHNSSDEPLGDEDDGKKSSPRDSQPDGSAVLSAAPDGDN